MRFHQKPGALRTSNAAADMEYGPTKYKDRGAGGFTPATKVQIPGEPDMSRKGRALRRWYQMKRGLLPASVLALIQRDYAAEFCSFAAQEALLARKAHQ